MEQQLNVNLKIPIPSDSVLVSKVELENLRQQSLSGLYWNMKDLERRTGKKHEWIKENILYPTRFKRILDVKNGGFVFFPEKSGQSWSFQAKEMAQFLDKYFSQIFSGEGKKGA